VTGAVADDGLPDEAWVVALSMLDGMGPARLRALLAQQASPRAAWLAVRDRRLVPGTELAEALRPDGRSVVGGWTRQAERSDAAQIWQRHVDAGIGVVLHGQGGFPEGFEGDPEPPSLLFHRGDPDLAVRPRVAIVGTRDCTRYGYDVAFELGRELSAVGVSVVSGLALGIDGAAHAGALEASAAPPVAVVGSGLDVVYPRRHAALWRQVARRGVMWSEYPLGSGALAWHFPARNRLIAALADVVVVVESHATGGALLTVDEAIARQRPVLAVPGPIRSAASAGCNQLIAENERTGVARDATDVLVALHLEPGSRRVVADRRPSPAPDDAALLEVLGWQPATLDQLVARTSGSLGEVSAAVTRLVLGGWIAERGGWYERLARREG
jgi:DNA processing protein